MRTSVYNGYNSVIYASINVWNQRSGSTEIFKISPGAEEEWDRSDPRGFVLSIGLFPQGENPANQSFLIFAGESVDVKSDGTILTQTRTLGNIRTRI